ETFFRGFLQNRIGLIAASILFGFAHIGYGTVAQIVFPFIYALVFGWLYKRTGTLVAPMAAHFAYDMIVLALAQIGG
ncbi:MAG: CPBP family intramembrane metalloprotease, partial [Candidatus Thermoplasmatota archaeon]|nr:CPBP family intramembrane metalloprotease [Candidatus Thermoplasmatota archaeon]